MREIRTKRVYEDPGPGDGRRILVDRLWPRGVSKDRIDDWVKELAPSTGLRQEFHEGSFDFDEFRDRYLIELDEKQDEMRDLLAGTSGPITLLFGLRDEKQNNATVLAEALRELPD